MRDPPKVNVWCGLLHACVIKCFTSYTVNYGWRQLSHYVRNVRGNKVMHGKRDQASVLPVGK